jgi:tetratricopeptide (TPR) repeat protein
LNRWDEAAQAYRTGLDLAPEEAASHLGMGDMLWRRNRLEEAIAKYREAVRCDPGSVTSNVRLADALGAAGRWEEAVVSLRDAISRQPESDALHACLGGALGSLARWDEAIAAFRCAIARETNPSSHHGNLAAALACANRHEEAIDEFRRALSHEPESALLHFRLGMVLRASEQWQEALAEFRVALAIEPQLEEARDHFGDVLSSTGHLEEAVVAYEHSVAREVESAAKEGRPVDARAVSVWSRGLGDALVKLHRWDDAARAYQRADDFNPTWTRAEPGPIAEHVQSWVESGWPAPSSDAVGGTRTMFVLDSDYGELTAVMLMLFGQEVSARATLVLSERLYVSNRDILPGRTCPAASLDDIVEAIERESPHVVFLCSAYLFSIHGLLSLEELEKLVAYLDKRGCRTVTLDPFLGLLSGLGMSTTIAIDIPEHAPAQLRRAKEEQDRLLRRHFSLSHAALKHIPHLYPSYPAAVGWTAPADPNVLSFFNAKLLCPLSPSGAVNDPAVAGSIEGSDATRPRWLFVLASRDYEAQIMFHGREYFVDVVIRKIEETLRAGRHPVFVAPYDLIQGVIAKMKPAPGVTLFTFCPFKKFITLLVDAEFAFYWNVVSHSMLLRLMNNQPVFMFDRGHLVRNVTPLYGRVVDWYYQGHEPMYLLQDERLDLDDLTALARGSAASREKTAMGFSRAPSPSTVIARLVGGVSGNDAQHANPPSAPFSS